MIHLAPRISLLLFFISLNFYFAQAQQLKPVPARIQQLRQDGTTFRAVDLFSASKAPKGPAEHPELQSKSQFLHLDKGALRELIEQRPEAITLTLPWRGSQLRIDLYQASVLAENFSIITSEQKTPAYIPGVYYRGIIQDKPGTLAAVSFFEDEVIGVISDPETGNLNLGRLQDAGNLLEYVLFNDQDLPEKPHFECLDLERPGWPDKKHPSQPEVTGCVQVFFECDFALYQNKGSVGNTVNYVTGFFNVVSTMYANETVSIAISQVFVWTTQDSYSTSSSSAALYEFQDTRTSFNGDLAHLVGLGGNGLGGIAFLDVLCVSGWNYAYSDINASYSNYPTYSWTINVVTHEMGHNLSSHHTHWCGWTGGAIDTCGPMAGYPTEGGCAPGPPPVGGGTIMSYCHLTSYGINFANGFGTQPGNAIRDAVGSAGCLAATCPTFSCSAPTSLTVSGLTAASAIIGWNAVSGAVSYNLQYRLYGASAWTTVTGASNPYTLTNLSGGTYYEVQVQTVCSGGSSPYRTGLLFKTATSACIEPSDLAADNLTGTSADIDWTENGLATQWEIQYGLQDFSLGSGTTVSTMVKPHTLSGLNGSTDDDVYVRSVCGGVNGNSTWVGPLTFTTLVGNDLSTDAILLVVDQACPGTNIYSNAGATGTGEFSPSVANGGYWDTNASNSVWFKFEAPASGSVRVSTDISPLGSLTDTQVALYDTEEPSSVNELLVSNEDGGSIGSGFAAVAYYSGLTPGNLYYIQVDGWGNNTGTFCITVSETFVIPNPSSCTSYTQANVNASATPDKWFNIYSKPNGYNIGQTVAAVKSALDLGTVTVQEIRNSNVQTAPNGVKYMQRYYNINASQNSSGPKSVRLFYADSELSSYKTATGQSGNTAEDLNISHYEGAVEDCTPNNNSSNGTTLLTDVSATSIGASGIFYLEFDSPGFSEFAAVFGSKSLPVELISFDGAVGPDRNTLRWRTAVEQGVAGFTLERSPDGAGLWQEVDRVEPQAAPSFPKQYQMDDLHPFGRTFYRLRITDLDESARYSPVVLLERALPDGLRSLYPNPAAGTIYAGFQASAEIPMTFRIIGSDGRLVLEQVVDLAAGLNILPFSLENQPAGLYYLTASGGGGMPFVKN